MLEKSIGEYIEKYQKPNVQKNQLPTEVTPYIFRFPFFLCLLHTVEVTGSNPVSPTICFQQLVYCSSQLAKLTQLEKNITWNPNSGGGTMIGGRSPRSSSTINTLALILLFILIPIKIISK